MSLVRAQSEEIDILYFLNTNTVNNKPNFLFYDYETFGTHPALDKVSQFACVKTDFNCNTLDQEYYFYCSPPNDYLPNPEAVLLTGITPQHTSRYGLNEFIFSKKIFKIFNVRNTCIIGYNNLQFDDEVTRNIFYRNLLDPYSWSWKNCNSRWDLIYLVRACYILTPSGVIWPKNKFGLISFKLEDLAKSNNIDYHSHDALSDVHTTILLMKFIRQKKPELFNFFFKYRLKNNIIQLIDIKYHTPIVYIASVFGFLRNYTTCISPLFWSIHSSNHLIFFDLYMDVNILINYVCMTKLDSINIKKLYDLGIGILNINKCPMLSPISLFTVKKLLTLGINIKLYLKKIDFLKQDTFFVLKLKKFFQGYIYHNITDNVDLKIYDSFFSQIEKNTMHKIHSIKIEHWKNIKFHCNSSKLKEMFFRLRARNFPKLLQKSEILIWDIHCRKVFSKNILNKYFITLQSLFNKYHYIDKKYQLLVDLKQYVDLLIMQFIL